LLKSHHPDSVLIIGSGIAGLSLALKLAECIPVTLLAKRGLLESNTRWAQGGIAAVLDPNDSIEQHVQDTLIAGDGLCDEAAVRFTAEAGKRVIEELVHLSVPFTPCNIDNDNDCALYPFHLTREGGHSHRRIIHAADHTGQSVQITLAHKARQHPNITLLEHYTAVDLIRVDGCCVGAYALNQATDEFTTFAARAVVLATGGAGKVYLYTSNPDLATGDGVAMAWRAGCRVANMEFMQFHPTVLFHPSERAFLVSEAVRGEGGLLKRPDGTRFMPDYDDRAELAPRDIVARAIDSEMKKLGCDHVWLDISHKPTDFITAHFPTIYKRCLSLGIDITKEPIPVVPAAHYTCGGVMTDHRAKTDLDNLYAVGEVAYTGLHGANRLASNSLLEALVYADAAYQDMIQRLQLGNLPTPPALPDWDDSQVRPSPEQIMVSHDWDELRRVMWDYVGIVRTRKRLNLALKRILMIREEIEEFYAHYELNTDFIELRNLALVSELIIRSALNRKESRGLHYNVDYPHKIEDSQPTIMIPKNPLR
jgi:L-aspartate oxidase